MKIITKSKTRFDVYTNNNEVAGTTNYKNSSLKEGIITIGGKDYLLKNISAGMWETRKTEKKELLATVKIATLGSILLELPNKLKKYKFKKTTSWKFRFLLLNPDGEEVLALLPSVNWDLQTHNFMLQLNEEFAEECDALLILQALHCSLCSMSMMNGSMIAAIAGT
jgi:hypothetical protein